jgi:hypothetical protein
MSLINAAVRQPGVTGRGSASWALRRAVWLAQPPGRGTSSESAREVDASMARARTGSRRLSWCAYGVANVAQRAGSRSGARARRRGATHSGAARFSVLDTIFVKILQLKCIQVYIPKLYISLPSTTFTKALRGFEQ